MGENESLKGHVVRMNSEYEVVLNLGHIDGVKKGDRFIIYEEGPEVYDHIADRELGRLELVKSEVVVDHVQEECCTASSPERTVMTRPGGLTSGIGLALHGLMGEYKTVRDELPVDPEQVERVERSGDLIGIGDLARRLPRSTEED